MNFDSLKRIPWWMKPWVAWKRWRAKINAARLEEARRTTPVFMGTVIGETTWTDMGYTEQTHCWELYETPLGQRTWKFRALGYYAKAEKHPLFSRVIRPWEEGLYTLDYDALPREVKYWRNKREIGVK